MPNIRSYDIVVIGGGIIGLATGALMAHEFPRHKIVVIEKESHVAQHQTGHNSGVVHAGIYYTPGSLKAGFCHVGGKMLREFCDQHGIHYKMCGKVIVATDESEIPRLEDLYQRGKANGVQGLEMIDKERLMDLEPYAAGVKAIFSPNTGIVDYGKVAAAYLEEMLKNDGDLITGAKVRSIVRQDRRLYVETDAGDISARHVVNCAGLHADTVARMMGIDLGVRIVPFRGEHYSIKPGRSYLVNGLIYPVPNPALPFLGAHFTRRIGGGVEAGPNAVLALAREGYAKTSINLRDTLGFLGYPGFWRMIRTHWMTGIREQYRSMAKTFFVRSLQTLIPEIRADDLHEPGAGVRAQAVGRMGELIQDFNIVQTENAIHVLNVPSPAATASMSISRYIVEMARESFSLSR